MVVKRTAKQDKVFQGISFSCAHFKNGTGVFEIWSPLSFTGIGLGEIH